MTRPAAAASRPVYVSSPDDPFGPVDQDPDLARDVACDLTVADAVCNPPEPEPFEPREFDTGTNLGGGGFGGGTLLVVLLVAVLAAFLVWLLVTIWRNRRPADDDVEDEDLDEDLDADVTARQVDHERPPDRWRRAAGDHRAAGRYRDAIRCEYRALVGDLARAGVVDEIPGRTSGEERVQLAELAPTVSADFDTAADLFDEAWFDDGPVDAADDERFVDASKAVLDVVLVGAVSRRAGGGQ